MHYQIDYTDEARRSIHKLPGSYRQRIKRLIESLATNPLPKQAKELRELPDCYRIRIDEWRIIYRVHDAEILVLIIDVRFKTGPETYHELE